MARQPLIDARRNREYPQSKYIEDALSEAMTEDEPKSSAPSKSPRPKPRPKKMAGGGSCRGMGKATRGGGYGKMG